MYRCGNCCEEFYRPDEIEIRTTYWNYKVASDLPVHTLKIVDVCPFCKSDDIDEVDDVYDAEVR